MEQSHHIQVNHLIAMDENPSDQFHKISNRGRGFPCYWAESRNLLSGSHAEILQLTIGPNGIPNCVNLDKTIHIRQLGVTLN